MLNSKLGRIKKNQALTTYEGNKYICVYLYILSALCVKYNLEPIPPYPHMLCTMLMYFSATPDFSIGTKC